MPDIRDLLRDAAAGPSGPLDVDRVRNRARQRRVRRRAGLVGAGAVTMAVVLLAGGLFLRDDGTKSELVVGPSTTTTVPGPNPVEVPVEDATSVALGARGVWVGRRVLAGGPGELLHIDVETLGTKASAPTSAPPLGVGVGRGGVWAAGGGDGAIPEGMLTRIDLGTQGMAAPSLLDTPDSSPRTIAMSPDATGDPYVWVADRQRLLRIDSTDNTLTSIPLEQAPRSVATDSTDVWVGTDSSLLHIDPTSGEVKTTLVNATWVAISRSGLYASNGIGGQAEVVRVDTGAAFESTSAATPLRARGFSGQLAADPLGDGVWVADESGVTYLREIDGNLAPVDGRQLKVVARDLVADGTYVWIVTDAGKLLRWRPPPG